MTASTRAIQVTHLNHIVTMVRDVQANIDFYCGFLGFKQIPSMVDNPRVTWLQLPSGVMLHLVESEEAPARPDNIHHAFEVEDYEATMRTLQEQGIAIERPGVRKDGQRYLFIRDPAGNRVELCTPSGF